MQTSVDAALLLNFFLTFARFEFALKNADFFKKPGYPIDPADPPDAQPDWDRFAVSIRDVFNPDSRSALRDACDYLLLNPPEREVVMNGPCLMWERRSPPEHLSSAERVILCVRRVRNNLFHGGKFTTQPVPTLDRNEGLLRSSLVILDECMTLSTPVSAKYEAAIL